MLYKLNSWDRGEKICLVKVVKELCNYTLNAYYINEMHFLQLETDY